MREQDKAREYVRQELKLMTDKLHAGRRSSGAVSGTQEPAMTIRKYNEQLLSLIDTLKLLDELENRLGQAERSE